MLFFQYPLKRFYFTDHLVVANSIEIQFRKMQLKRVRKSSKKRKKKKTLKLEIANLELFRCKILHQSN